MVHFELPGLLTDWPCRQFACSVYTVGLALYDAQTVPSATHSIVVADLRDPAACRRTQ